MKIIIPLAIEIEDYSVEELKRQVEARKRQIVTCENCKYLAFSDFYGECGLGCMGIVRPDDFCSRGEKRSKEKNAQNA